MADFAVTPASVIATGTAQKFTGTAGATIAQGDAVYLDATDSNKVKLADANSATASVVAGVALGAASAGQPVTYVQEDATFTHGLTGVSTGDIIILSSTEGKLCPAADLSSTEYPVVVMVAISATQAVLKITRGTAAKA